MADATKIIFAKLDLANNQIRRFAIDNVDSLPDTAPAGRVVFHSEHLWLFDGTSWIQLADSVILREYQRIDEKDQPGGYAGLDEDGKLAVGQIPTDPSEEGYIPLIVGEVADGQSIVYDSESGGFVGFEVSTLYTFKGTCTSDELDLKEDPKVGDVWNLSDERVWQGHSYTAGTSWAWEGSGWEPLAGSLDLTPYQLIANMVQDMLSPSEETYPSTRAVSDYVTSYVGEYVTDYVTAYVEDYVGKAIEEVSAEIPDVINDWAEATAENVPSAELVRTALDSKTDVTMAVPSWDSSATYRTGSTVVVGGTIYISLRDSNTGNSPVTSEGWWTAVQGSGSGGGEGEGTAGATASWGSGIASVRCVTFTVGDGESTSYYLNHDLQTFDVMVSARTNESPSRLVDAKFVMTSALTVRMDLTTAPATDGLVVSVMSVLDNTAGTGNVAYHTETFGTETDTEYTITHGLGTRDVFVTVRTSTLPSRIVQAAVSADTDDTVTISLTDAPGLDGMVVTVMAPTEESEGGGTGLSVVTYHQSEASDVWTFEHGLGTWCFVQVYGEDGDQMIVNVMQDPETLDTVTVTFGTPMTGYAVIAPAGDVSDSAITGYGAGDVVALGASSLLALTNASGEWTVRHDRGRLVLVQIYGTDGDEIKAEVIQDLQTLNSVRIRFTEEVSGTAVII